MNPLDKILAEMRTFFEGINSVTLEWSLNVSRNTITDSNRLTLWLRTTAQNQTVFNKITEFLLRIDCPSAILEKQQKHAQYADLQGLGVAEKKNTFEWRFYASKYHANDTITDVSYRWESANAYRKDVYKFCYFPEVSPETQKQIHTIFKNTPQQLAENAFFQEKSGYWLRYYKEELIHISQVFFWHPVVYAYKESFIQLCAALNAPTDWIATYWNHHFRHITFATQKKEPHFTVYFVAYPATAWPHHFDDLKQKARIAAQTEIHKLMLQDISFCLENLKSNDDLPKLSLLDE
jgi:hypothetical protein